MPAPKSVSEIKSALLRPALTSHFEVEIPFPSGLRSLLGVNQGNLNLSCSEASLPGSQLATLEQRNDHTGVTEKHAYRRQFDDRIDLTFYVDAGNYTSIRFFEAWISYAMGEDLQTGENSIAAKNYNYRARYPNEYIMDQGLTVTKFERDYKQQLKYNFVRAFPLSISSMPVSFDASSLLKVTVSMSYIRYYVLNLPKQRSAPPTQTAPDQAAINKFAFASAFDPKLKLTDIDFSQYNNFNGIDFSTAASSAIPFDTNLKLSFTESQSKPATPLQTRNNTVPQ